MEVVLFIGKWSSFVFGWASFFIWAMSFYPQVIKNFIRRSAKGYSVEFLYINSVGFVCYSVYNIALFCVPSVQASYMAIHPEVASPCDIPVHLSDILFSLHASLMNAIIFVQMIIFPAGKQRLGWFAGVFTAISTVIVGGAAAFTIFDVASSYYLLAAIGLVKNIASFTMYLPQLVLNIKRQSTEGWAIGSSLLDITASSLNVLQLIIDILLNGHNFLENIPKLLVAVSMAFDVTFVIQHYFIYRKPKDAGKALSDDSPDPRQPLLINAEIV